MKTVVLSAIDSEEGRRALERSLEPREGSARWIDLNEVEFGPCVGCGGLVESLDLQGWIDQHKRMVRTVENGLHSFFRFPPRLLGPLPLGDVSDPLHKKLYRTIFPKQGDYAQVNPRSSGQFNVFLETFFGLQNSHGLTIGADIVKSHGRHCSIWYL